MTGRALVRRNFKNLSKKAVVYKYWENNENNKSRKQKKSNKISYYKKEIVKLDYFY